MNAAAAALRALEDELHRRRGAGAEYDRLAREVDLSAEIVRELVARAEDRLLGSRRERDRRVRRQAEPVETFEQRVERFSRSQNARMTNHPWLATEVSIRCDKAADTPGHSGALRECPVCLRLFRAGRLDSVTCSAHCRDLARRVRGGDASAQAAVRMLFAPPACLGCGEPLWARRPDTKHCGSTCAKRAQRDRQAVR